MVKFYIIEWRKYAKFCPLTMKSQAEKQQIYTWQIRKNYSNGPGHRSKLTIFLDQFLKFNRAITAYGTKHRFVEKCGGHLSDVRWNGMEGKNKTKGSH